MPFGPVGGFMPENGLEKDSYCAIKPAIQAVEGVVTQQSINPNQELRDGKS
jgi:hypothetical protein